MHRGTTQSDKKRCRGGFQHVAEAKNKNERDAKVHLRDWYRPLQGAGHLRRRSMTKPKHPSLARQRPKGPKRGGQLEKKRIEEENQETLPEPSGGGGQQHVAKRLASQGDSQLCQSQALNRAARRKERGGVFRTGGEVETEGGRGRRRPPGDQQRQKIFSKNAMATLTARGSRDLRGVYFGRG